MSGSGQTVSKLRFFVEVNLTGGTVRLDDESLLNQWRKVLRLKEGSTVVLVVRDGLEATAVITSLDKNAAELQIVSTQQNDREPSQPVTLYCAMLKRENFEWVAQKAVEVGASRLVPIMTERTIKLGFKRERIEAIIREAAEQSGRGLIPALSEPMPLEQAIADSTGASERYFFDVGGEPLLTITGKPAAAFIGPEGGWSEAERALAAKAGLKSVGLGKLVLRAETAAMVAVYLLAQRPKIS